jgi:hypothetical protein
MRWSFILARIAARSGAALRHQRIAWLTATMGLAAFGIYGLSYARPSLPSDVAAGASTSDCADTVMAAATGVDDNLTRAAYACWIPSQRLRTEDEFVASQHDPGMLRGVASRVAEQRTPDGGRIVFFTIEHQSETIGYMIYLDSQGMVLRVE